MEEAKVVSSEIVNTKPNEIVMGFKTPPKKITRYHLNIFGSAIFIGISIIGIGSGLIVNTQKSVQTTHIENQDQLSRYRYENNCLQFKDNNGNFVALNPQVQITDAGGRLLAPGVFVCDGFGATAVVGNNGYPTEFAIVQDWNKYLEEKSQRVFGFQKKHETTVRNQNQFGYPKVPVQAISDLNTQPLVVPTQPKY